MRPQSQEPPNPALSSSQNFSIGSHLSGFNALLKSKSKLQDEFFQNQREVRKREGELQKTLAVQDQKIMQLQETIKGHQAREIQLKQMYDKILLAFSGDSGSLQQSLLLMFDLTQNTKDQCIQELMQKFRSVLNTQIQTRDRHTQTSSDSADADTSTSSIIEKHCIKELHEVIDKMKAQNERLNSQITFLQKEHKTTIHQIKGSYEKQVSELQLQIEDLKLMVMTKIGEDDFCQSQSQQMQAQLMNDNIQMHEIIELLKNESEELSKSTSETIQSLINENQELKQEVRDLEISKKELRRELRDLEESAKNKGVKQADEVADLKQKVANALKLAGEKSDDAMRCQIKLERLVTRIEDKKRSRLEIQQPEQQNSTPATLSKNFNLPQKSDLPDRLYQGITSMKSPKFSDTLTLMTSPQESKRESLKSGQSSKADYNSNQGRGMVQLNTEAAPLDLLQSHAKLYQKYLSSVKSPAFVEEENSSEKKSRCITPSYTRKDMFDKYGNDYDPNSNKSEDGCIVYGTISKKDRNTNSKLERSPELTNLVDQIVTEIKKLDRKRQSSERMHCSCGDSSRVVQCTHYHYPQVQGQTIQKMESQLAKLADNNYKLKQLIKEKEESEEKCSKLKGKLNGLKQQVDQTASEKFEAILKCQHLELRLKQAQQVLQCDDATPILMKAKNVQQMGAAQILGMQNLGRSKLAQAINQELDQQSITTERNYHSQKDIQSIISPRNTNHPNEIQRMVSPRSSLHPNVKLNHNQQQQKTVIQSTVGSPTASNDRGEIQKSRVKGIPLLQLSEINEIDTVKLFRSPKANMPVTQVFESDRSSGKRKTQRRLYSNRYEETENNEMMLIKQEKSPIKIDQISPIVPPDKGNPTNTVKQAKVPTMLMRATTYSHFNR